MKIANTTKTAKISFTENEYTSLGRPTRAELTFNNQTLTVAPSDIGTSVYRQTNDALYPYGMNLRKDHKFRKGRKQFGAEVVEATTRLGEQSLTADLPKMNRPVTVRNFGGDHSRKVVNNMTIVEQPKPIDTADIIKQAVDYINGAKERLGKNLILTIDEDGFLEIMTRAGR